MFTGLVEKVGRLVALDSTGAGATVRVAHDAWETPLVQGESVAVQGACLTVASVGAGEFVCDVLAETLDRTTLASTPAGAALNLERALRLGDRLGGHMVSGHVDGLGTLAGVRRAGRDRVLRVACAGELLRGIVSKGSIAVDGVSLTVAALDPDAFEVAIIPTTWEQTSLGVRQVGDRVNLETDMLGKYVQRLLGRTAPGAGICMDDLQRAGFVA